MDLGDGKVTLKSKNQLKMNKWYHIKVVRAGTSSELFINGQDKRTVKAPKSYTILNIGDKLYFGGVEKISTK